MMLLPELATHLMSKVKEQNKQHDDTLWLPLPHQLSSGPQRPTFLFWYWENERQRQVAEDYVLIFKCSKRINQYQFLWYEQETTWVPKFNVKREHYNTCFLLFFFYLKNGFILIWSNTSGETNDNFRFMTCIYAM